MTELDFYQLFQILKKEKEFIKHQMLFNLISDYIFTAHQIKQIQTIFPDKEYNIIFEYLYSKKMIFNIGTV